MPGDSTMFTYIDRTMVTLIVAIRLQIVKRKKSTNQLREIEIFQNESVDIHIQKRRMLIIILQDELEIGSGLPHMTTTLLTICITLLFFPI